MGLHSRGLRSLLLIVFLLLSIVISITGARLFPILEDGNVRTSDSDDHTIVSPFRIGDQHNNDAPAFGQTLKNALYRPWRKNHRDRFKTFPQEVSKYFNDLSKLPQTMKLDADGSGNLKNINITEVSHISFELPPRITIWNPHGKIHRIALTSGVKVSFSVEVTLELFGVNTTAMVYQKIGDWYANATLPNIRLRSILSHVPGKDLSYLLHHPLLKRVQDLAIVDTKVVIPIREDAYFGKFTGRPVIPIISDFSNRVQVIAGTINGFPVLATMFFVDPRKFSNFIAALPELRHLTSLKTIDWFKRMPFHSLIYTTSIAQVSFSDYPDLSPDYTADAPQYFTRTLSSWYANPLAKGHSIAGLLRSPKTCLYDDDFCNFLQFALRNNSYLVSSGINNSSYLEFRAELKSLDLKFTKLEPAGLLIALNPEWPHYAFFGQFNKTVGDGQRLRFRLEVGIASDNYTSYQEFFSFNRCGTGIQMDGLWQSPYGMNWLTIGNGHMRGFGQYGLPWQTPFDIYRWNMGAEFYIGHKCLLADNATFDSSSGCIQGSGDLMTDRKNFLAEFWQVHLNKFTVRELFHNIFPDWKVDNYVSNHLLDSGFPDGVNASFAWVPTIYPYRTIPQGFALRAPITFMNQTAWAFARIAVPQPTIFYIDIATPPMLLTEDGGIVLYKSKLNRTSGPQLYFNISLEAAHADSGAYLKVYDWFEGWFEVKFIGNTLQIESAKKIPGWFATKTKIWATTSDHSVKGLRWYMELDLDALQSYKDIRRKAQHYVKDAMKELNETILLLRDQSSLHSTDLILGIQGEKNCYSWAKKCVHSLCETSRNTTAKLCDYSSKRLFRTCLLKCRISKLSPGVARRIWKTYSFIVDRTARLLRHKLNQNVDELHPFELNNATIDTSLQNYLHKGSFDVHLSGRIYNFTTGEMQDWHSTVKGSHDRLIQSMVERTLKLGVDNDDEGDSESKKDGFTLVKDGLGLFKIIRRALRDAVSGSIRDCRKN